MYFWLVEYKEREWKIYTVASVMSHYAHKGDNSETTLRVYLEGDAGHVMDISCLFPPDFSLEGGPNPDYAELVLENKPPAQWSGIEKVRKKQKAVEYLSGVHGYFCEKVQ